MTDDLGLGEQFTLPGLDIAEPRLPVGVAPIASQNPIARVYVEKVPLHLDQTFDYLVPEALSLSAEIGSRVKVPFGAQTLTGYIFDRVATSDHRGKLAQLKSVVSQGPIVTEQTFALCGLVANYYAGTMSDTLRLAVPPRAAKVEKEFFPRPTGTVQDTTSAYADLGGNPATGRTNTPSVGNWQVYGAGTAFLEHLAAGGAPRAVWTALPGLNLPTSAHPDHETGGAEPAQAVEHWMLALIEAIEAARSGGRGALIILPTSREVSRFAQALDLHGFTQFTAQSGKLGDGSADYVRLTHDMGATPRYRSYLAALTGAVNIVIGTRGAAFAPVINLGLVACWSDGDESHQELQAPYSHVREVLALRSEQFGAALLIGGIGRSVHAQALVHSGWAHDLKADRATVRQRTPRVLSYGDYELERDGRAAQGRLPSRVWSKISLALAHGPVLISVPRAGYIPLVACANCRTAAHCGQCHGPLSVQAAGGTPQCKWCGALAGNWACSQCHSPNLRAMRMGSDRTAEELGRAFPQTSIKVSGAKSQGGIIDSVTRAPALVIATPGAEPLAEGGYVLGVILDAQVGSAGTGLYADQETLDRWLGTSSLVRSTQFGGEVYLVGQGSAVPTAALVRWDPIGMADRELEQRFELSMPPAWRVASVTGERLAVAQFLAALHLPDGGSVLGPVEIETPGPKMGRVRAEDRVPTAAIGTMDSVVRAIIRVPVGQGRQLAKAIRAMQSIASARRSAALVNVVLDPKELL